MSNPTSQSDELADKLLRHLAQASAESGGPAEVDLGGVDIQVEVPPQEDEEDDGTQ